MRFFQYLDNFREAGDEIEWVQLKEFSASQLEAASSADVILCQESLISLGLARRLRRLNKPLVFDWDDALYTRPGKPYRGFTKWRVLLRLHWWLKNAKTVTVSNLYLQKYSLQHGARHVEVIPMALLVPPAAPRSLSKSQVSVGWGGSSASLPYLMSIEQGLQKVIAEVPRITLRVLCDVKPRLSLPFEYIPWSLEQERFFYAGLDIGLLPLIDEPFVRGKSPAKALQYMVNGVPYAATRVPGGPEEIATNGGAVFVNNGDWVQAVRTLTNPEAYYRLSLEGLEKARKHDKSVVFQQFRHALLKVKKTGLPEQSS